MKQRDGLLTHPPPHYEEKPTSSSPSFSRISPALVWIIVTLAAIFFISGLIHLLIRYLIKKRPSFSMIHHSNRYQDTTRPPQSLQGQLQQLFHLHDSGLDQPAIDSLPVFGYRDIMGSNEPFDCAVCLSEFSFQDKMRLLPICGHAFHIDCIGTWLLSNSTCPLCRATLLALGASGLSMENPFPHFNEQHSRESSESSEAAAAMSGVCVSIAADDETVSESGGIEKRVFSLRLGKLRSCFSDDDQEQIEGAREQVEEGGTGPSLDARRCYSMGTYQYVVGDMSLQVSLPEGKRVCGGSRGESLSVSKVWLWSKRSKVPGSLDTPMWVPCNNSSLGLSTSDRSQFV